MCFIICLLMIMHEVSVIAAQGLSCHYKNGCNANNDVCSVPPPACVTGWFGQYCQMHNIALGKTASQSSTWTDTTGSYDASKAVDGDVNTHFGHGSCSHTDEPNSGNASWHVLLGGTFLISRITIYLRDDGTDHNEAMEILVSGNTCRKLPVADIRDSPTHLITNPVTISCTEPTEGDNVTIVMAGPFLSLCEVQVFGKKKESCHCSNGCSDFPNTSCSTSSSGPVCKSPWFGSFCQMENIAFQKTARQSSTYNDTGGLYCAAHAVDGNTDTDLSHRSCSHTNEAVGGTASWQVVLDDHQMFNISRIRIFLRSDQADHNKNMTVLVNGGVCYSVSGTTLQEKVRSGSNPFDVTCTQVMKGNNVTITMKGQFLTLCEVQVFVCSDGWFGSDCDKKCQCLNTSEVCDKDTGYCKSGWAAGKQVPGCQQDCKDGYYGRNCLQQCGSCKDGTYCNKSNGECPQGCKTNFQAPYCKDCEDGYYGRNCSQQCGSCKDGTHCNKINGECPQGCKTNFQAPHCKDCEDGYYGGNCSQQCGSCKDGTHCNKINGECPQGCKTNFQAPHCKDCEDGYCGGNCSQQCGSCKDGTHCNKINGECPQGCKTNFQAPHCKDCKDGYYGGNCLQQCGSCKDGTYCNKINGECLQGCKTNFQAPYCKDCEGGYYGGNCLQQCGSCTDGTHCNKSNGECPQGCKTNFQAQHCKVCKDGLYGTDCSKHCKCRNRTETCDKVTGNCRSGCPAGIRGSGCQEECADYTYGVNCSGVCSCLNQCEVCEKMTGECQTGYHTTTAEKSTAIPLKNENIGHKTVCCLMVVLGVYAAAATTLVFRLKRKNAKTQAELEKQYMTLETRGESSVYDVIAGTHTYCNDVQPENSDYENTNSHVMKRDEHSL